ncbi:unnamed protein product [Rangifer tarandus platyrhynchus]|uniref:Uncharacterized protein n=1 Tax=Rangifer tarandus platyrhynchus TaxID=3082113 RepID=A0AC59Y8A2_RANTA
MKQRDSAMAVNDSPQECRPPGPGELQEDAGAHVHCAGGSHTLRTTIRQDTEMVGIRSKEESTDLEDDEGGAAGTAVNSTCSRTKPVLHLEPRVPVQRCRQQSLRQQGRDESSQDDGSPHSFISTTFSDQVSLTAAQLASPEVTCLYEQGRSCARQLEKLHSARQVWECFLGLGAQAFSTSSTGGCEQVAIGGMSPGTTGHH